MGEVIELREVPVMDAAARRRLVRAVDAGVPMRALAGRFGRCEHTLALIVRNERRASDR